VDTVIEELQQKERAMNAAGQSGATEEQHRTTAERRGERELVVTRTFDAPPPIVFAAWTQPELIKSWWAPKSSGVPLLSVEVDVRVGGRYRYVFGTEGGRTMAFFGQYTEVVPNARIVWTNEESDEGAISTLTLTEKDGKTLLMFSELYPTKEAADRACEGMEDGMPEQFAQLDELLLLIGEGQEKSF
jgi:uncharacterized protein YndB with AHSA1/START domain